MSFNGDLNATDDGLELETKGQIHTYSTENTALDVGTDGYILSADSTEGTGLKYIANTDAGLTLGAKGDIHTRSASDQAALAVGANLKSLYANSAETTGLQWNTNARETLTAAGDILYASGANTLAKLAKGSDTDVLTLASGLPSWAAAAGGGSWEIIESYTSPSTASSHSFNFSAIDFDDYSELVLTINGSITAALGLRVELNGLSSGMYGDGFRTIAGTFTGINNSNLAYNEIASSSIFRNAGESIAAICYISFSVDPDQNTSMYSVAYPSREGFECMNNFHNANISSLTSVFVSTSTSTWIAGTRMTLYKVKRS